MTYDTHRVTFHGGPLDGQDRHATVSIYLHPQFAHSCMVLNPDLIPEQSDPVATHVYLRTENRHMVYAGLTS